MNNSKAITAIALITLWSCSANSTQEDAINKTSNETLQERKIDNKKGDETLQEKQTDNNKVNKTLQEKQGKIIRGTEVSKTGEQLGYEFDNSANTMRIFFNGDTDVLKGEQMASGIKYSSKVYTYTEWQGNSTLFKNGVKVFEATKSK